MQRLPTYWRFLKECFLWSIGGVWGVINGVALLVAIVLAFVQLLWPDVAAKIPLNTIGFWNGVIPTLMGIAVFIIGFILAPYFLWREKAEEVLRLEKSLEPRLRVLYDLVTYPGCKRNNVSEDPNGTWDHQEVFRLAVQNTGTTPVGGCRGILSEITFADHPEPIFGGNNWNLAFAPNDDLVETSNKTINNGTPEFLDMLFLEFRHQSRVDVFMGTANRQWPNHFPRPNIMFDRDGVYYFKINIVSTTPPIPVRVKFTISHAQGESIAELVPS